MPGPAPEADSLDVRRARSQRRRRPLRGPGPGEMNPQVLLGVAPIGVFWIARRIVDTQVAIGAGFAAALLVVWITRGKRGVIGWLALAGLVIVGGAAIAGIVLDSDKVFLANDPIGDFIGAAVFLGSAVIGRPLVGLLACEIYPNLATYLRARDRVFAGLSLFWAVQNATTGGIRVVLLDSLSANDYILWSRVVSWPLGIAGFAFTYWIIGRTIDARYRARELAVDPV